MTRQDRFQRLMAPLKQFRVWFNETRHRIDNKRKHAIIKNIISGYAEIIRRKICKIRLDKNLEHFPGNKEKFEFVISVSLLGDI